MRLNKTAVDALKAPAEGQRFEWDDTLKGFGVRVTPGSKSYVAQSRVNGRTRRVTLGSHTEIACDEARKRAKKALAAMSEDVDPNAEKKIARATSVTLREVTEGYISDHTDLKASSIANIRKHVFGLKPKANGTPALSFKQWVDLPVTTITRDKVQTLYRKMVERSPAQANQKMRVLRALMNYARATYRNADDTPLLPENPVAVLSDAKVWARVEPKKRRVPLDKVGVAWTLLAKLRSDEAQAAASRTGADIASFLLLTGCRWSEAAQLTWDRVDLDGASWHLPDPKNRNAVTFPLSSTAVDLLKARVGLDATYVFPARSRGGYLHSATGTFDKLSEAIGGIAVSAHDMRRTFRAIADRCGIELWKTKALMNHVSIKQDVTLGSYTDLSDLRYLSDDIEKVAKWIANEARIATASNVVKLRA
jgi:integrase